MKEKNWYSEWHETTLHPTMTVHEQERDDRPRIVLPDGRELVARPQMGFHKNR